MNDRTGQLVTIVFRVTDEKDFSTLRMVGEKWKGMESVGIATGDLMQMRDRLREALREQIFAANPSCTRALAALEDYWP